MSDYRSFVKSEMLKMRASDLTPQEKMKKVGEKWRAHSHKSKPAKAKKGGAVTGGGIFHDVGQGVDSVTSWLGLGLTNPHKRTNRRKALGGDVVGGALPKPRKGKGRKLKGAGVFGDIGTGIDAVASFL